jgi:hypothetical protein
MAGEREHPSGCPSDRRRAIVRRATQQPADHIGEEDLSRDHRCRDKEPPSHGVHLRRRLQITSAILVLARPDA